MYVFLFFSEVNAGFFYKSAEDRERLVKAERQHTDKKVTQIIDLKKKVCSGNDKGFVVINQKVAHLYFHKMNWNLKAHLLSVHQHECINV